MARRWEEQARRKRAAQGALPRKPTMRYGLASLLTQREVGLIMGLSDRTIRQIEKEAFAKVRSALSAFWREYTGGNLEEANDWALSRAEVAALYRLTRTSAERQALTKLLNLMASHGA